MNKETYKELKEVGANKLASLYKGNHNFDALPNDYFEEKKRFFKTIPALENNSFHVKHSYFDQKKNELKQISLEAKNTQQGKLVNLSWFKAISAVILLVAISMFIVQLLNVKQPVLSEQELAKVEEFSEFDIAVLTGQTHDYFYNSLEGTSIEGEEDQATYFDAFYNEVTPEILLDID